MNVVSNAVEKAAPAVVKSIRRRYTISEKIVLWAVVIASTVVIASFTLAAYGKDTNTTVTTAVFAACVSEIIVYYVKSLSEKLSRNKYQLDESGNPINNNKEEH